MSSVERVLGLLGAISRPPRGASDKDVSTELQIPPTSVHRLLVTCVEVSFCDQDPDSLRYLPRPRLIELTRTLLDDRNVITASQPELKRLRELTGETALLTTVIGLSATCVAVESSDRPVRLYIQLGLRMPFHASAAARAILAFRPVDEAKRLLGNEEFVVLTKNTPHTIGEVLALLAAVRDDGYATSLSELDENVLGIAAPIQDRGGEVSSSLCVALPPSGFLASDGTEVAKAVVDSSARVSASLGWRADR